MSQSLRYLGTPAAAVAAGCPARFHFWQGASGRRYLFTEVEAEALPHFRGVVILVAEPATGDDLAVYRLAPMETAGDLKPLLRGVDRRKVLVHLLATTPAARRAVVADLSPEESWALAA